MAHQKNFVMLAAVVLISIASMASVQAGPTAKPGNPGLPGCLAEANQLEQVIANQNQTITGLEQQINTLQALLDAMKNYSSVPQTGQKYSYAPGDDGDLRKGVAWPVPRFTNNGDGTVTDNLTKLIWLKNVDCLGNMQLMNWSAALSEVNNLSDNQCGLTDGSMPGDWRMPNARELLSLIHYGFTWPALPDTTGTGQCSDSDPFVVWGNRYWSSTSYVPGYAWSVGIHDGSLIYNSKDDVYRVWPVRGGK